MLNSKKNVFMNSNDIVNSQDIKRTIINVDSRFKDNISDTPSDFYYRPATPFKNIIRLRLVSAEIPNIWYAFSEKRKNIAFDIILKSTMVRYTVRIDEGNYTLGASSTNLLDAVQFELTRISTLIGGGMNLEIQLDPVRTQIIIFDDSATPQEFLMDFEIYGKDRPNDWGLGYALGFRSTLYGMGSRYLAEAPPDVHIDPYILISVNDYECFQQNSGSIGVFAFAKLIIHEDKYNIIFADESSIYTREYIFGQPTNIAKFHIRLLDMYGEELEMRKTNISLSFEISEITNAKIYNDYLNYGRS